MIKQIVFSDLTTDTALGRTVMAGTLEGPSLKYAALMAPTATSLRKTKIWLFALNVMASRICHIIMLFFKGNGA